MVKKHLRYTAEARLQMVELHRSARKFNKLYRGFGCSSWAIRYWVKQADRDSGRGDGGLSTAVRVMCHSVLLPRRPGVYFEEWDETPLGSWCGKRFRPEQVEARNDWQTIPVGRNQEFHEVKSPLILQPSTAALTDGLDVIHRVLMQWAERCNVTQSAP